MKALIGDVMPFFWTLIGALIMAVLTNGLRVLSVAPEWQTVVTGAIIIVAVYADQLRRGRAG